jgi:amino-acid N-acetyltransferase
MIVEQDFFSRLGFRAVARDAAPAVLRAGAEFASICPSTATCMMLAP